jgi:hypothetical protein
LITRTRAIGWGLLCSTLPVWTAFGQGTVPLADPVDKPRLPTGLSALPVDLSAKLVYVFTDPEGENALHFIGDFTVRIASESGTTLRSREAIVWIIERELDEKKYQQLQILLWREAEIREVGGTTTTGPALFVTLNTTGAIRTHADDITFQSSARSRIFQEAAKIRVVGDTAEFREGDESVAMRVIDASGLAPRPDDPRPKPIVTFRSGGEFSLIDRDAEGRQALTVTGGVYLSRGVPGSEEFLEIQADAAVVFPHPRARGGVNGEPSAAGLGGEPPVLRPDRVSEQASPIGPTEPKQPRSDEPRLESPLGDINVDGVYLEGDIRMAQGPHMITASRIYYDLVRDRAVILDAIVFTILPDRDVPLYLRAEEVRQLSRSEFVANEAVLTTSEFHTPHYHIGAERVELSGVGTPAVARTSADDGAGRFRIRGATLNLEGHPIAYWPYVTGSTQTSETALRNLRTGYSGDFGVEIETQWYLFNLLGLETPKGFDATLRLDEYTDRGPAAGVDAEYKRDRYYGLLRSYLLRDSDEDNLGRERESMSHSDTRGRFLLRHRQFLEDDWQLTLEAAYISDRGFLEEFFEPEFDNDKEQETLLHLKRQRDNWAFTAMLQSRPLDFLTQTERLPDFGLFLMGEPLSDAVSWHSENRLGIVRYRPMDQTFRELLRDGRLDASGSVMRIDSRQEVGAPLDVGPWRLVPFAVGRGTAWDDSPRHGGTTRAFGSVGVRGSMYLWHVNPDVRSALFDIEGIRHIIKPDFVVWGSATNRNADNLYPFDESVEGIDSTDGITIGLRQRWQTRRGVGKTRRDVDLFTWDLEMGVFNNADGDAATNGFASFSRPENSVARNYVSSATVYRINDRTALLSELNYDMNDGEVDILNVSLAVERSPRMSYILGYRFIEESDSNLLAFAMNYRMTEKHTLALREAFDIDRGKTHDFTIALIRRFPRWFTAISFALDEAEDDFGVSFSLWPEGLPNAVLGSRRFTGLAGSTRLESP